MTLPTLNHRLKSLIFNSLGTTLRALWTCVLRAAAIALLPLPLKVGIDQILLLGAQPPTQLHSAEVEWVSMFPSTSAALYGSALLMIVLAIAVAFLTRITETNAAAAAHQIVERLRESFLEQLMHVKQTYFKTHRAHDLATRLSHDNSTIESAISSGLVAVGFAVPAALFSIIFMALADSRLALLLIFGLPLLYIVTAQSARQWTVHALRAQRETDHFVRDVAQALDSLTPIKNVDMERPVLRKLMSRLRLTQTHVSSSERAQAWAQARQELMKNGLRAGLLAVGGLFFLRGQSSLGSLILFLAYVETVPNAIAELAKFRGRLRASARAVERITDLEHSLSDEREIDGARGVSSLPFPDADVLTFENVTYDIAENDGAITQGLGLHHFSADFEPGELVAVTSAPNESADADDGAPLLNVCDASAFGALLNRVVEPQVGRILLGNSEISRFKLSVLRQLVTVIDREPFFIHGSVRENLLLEDGASSSPNNSIDEQNLNVALHAAGVDFINELPDRLETVIGDGGFELTPAQMIRLGFARAFLKPDSKIFFFNRVADHLGDEEATLIFESLRHLTERGALVFWVTNRQNEIEQSDRVVLLGTTVTISESHAEVSSSELVIEPTLNDLSIDLGDSPTPKSTDRHL